MIQSVDIPHEISNIWRKAGFVEQARIPSPQPRPEDWLDPQFFKGRLLDFDESNASLFDDWRRSRHLQALLERTMGRDRSQYMFSHILPNIADWGRDNNLDHAVFASCPPTPPLTYWSCAASYGHRERDAAQIHSQILPEHTEQWSQDRRLRSLGWLVNGAVDVLQGSVTLVSGTSRLEIATIAEDEAAPSPLRSVSLSNVANYIGTALVVKVPLADAL